MKTLMFFMYRAILIFSTTFIAFSIIRTRYFKSFKKGSSPKREFLMSVFYSYAVTMLIFLFMPHSFVNGSSSITYFDLAGNFSDILSGANINLIPFRTIKNYLLYAGMSNAMLNIVGNIFMFIPFGYLLPKIYPEFNKLSSMIIFLTVCIIAIETMQLTVGRTFDIDDFILNFFGGLVGYFIRLIDHS